MKKKILFLTVLATSLLQAKAQSHHKEVAGNNKIESRAKKGKEAIKPFQRQLTTLFSTSMTLTDALVSSDVPKAQAATALLTERLAIADSELAKGQIKSGDWAEHRKTMQTALEQISCSKDLGTQRKHFAQFSEALSQSIKIFGLGGATAYLKLPDGLGERSHLA
ncbi:DUF3347 domain-containing protein [Rufibacter sp. LB8]|uniref:DUF3347 domain-containing protein n=1 Tax=Rufibacter sp. LB8 TaxID=2777781 RepID=UPI00178C4990|nr:DUF3347 domain-containing protein [Rufibacter sp. LB8]